jgi:hypothetical protein
MDIPGIHGIFRPPILAPGLLPKWAMNTDQSLPFSLSQIMRASQVALEATPPAAAYSFLPVARKRPAWILPSMIGLGVLAVALIVVAGFALSSPSRGAVSDPAAAALAPSLAPTTASTDPAASVLQSTGEAKTGVVSKAKLDRKKLAKRSKRLARARATHAGGASLARATPADETASASASPARGFSESLAASLSRPGQEADTE